MPEVFNNFGCSDWDGCFFQSPQHFYQIWWAFLHEQIKPSGRGTQLLVLSHHHSITRCGTIRTLPNNLQGWLESQNASRSAPRKWFVHSRLLWSFGEFNPITEGTTPADPGSAGRSHGPDRLYPACARPRSKQTRVQATFHDLVINFSPRFCHTNCTKEGRHATQGHFTAGARPRCAFKALWRKNYVVPKKSLDHKSLRKGKQICFVLTFKRQTFSIFVRRCPFVKTCQVVCKERLYLFPCFENKRIKFSEFVESLSLIVFKRNLDFSF